MQKRLLIVLAFCNIFISFTNAQSIECSLDETTFSGTITTTGAGGVKIKASDATSNYRFGERVAIDGNIAVTVSRNNGAVAGKVYVYINDGSGNWSQQTILTASDGFAGDNFGSSVALEGNYLVVGARSQTNTSVVDSGAAYLFEYDGVSTWTEVKIFEPSDGSSGDRFGESVSIEGNLILVGARDGAVGGCAYLYENDGTNTFTYTETKLEPQVQSNYSGAKFGYDVLVKDGRAYVGGPADYSSVGRASAGSVQIWDQANDGSWSRTHRLRGTETSEYFGSAISVNGDYLAIGAYNFEVSSTPEADQGRVFVYKADINGDYLDANRVMVQNDDKDSYNDQRFGTDVVIDNGFLYVGTFGNGSNSTDAVYIFKDDSTNNWSQLTKLTSGGGWDEFSNRALAVSYPYLLIGQNEDDSPSNSGAIHFVSLASTITPTASISEVTSAFIGQNNATIKLNFTDEATRTEIQFSIDGGTTYPYAFSDDSGTADITNLGVGSYDLKAKYNSGSCVLDLGTVSVNQAPYTAIPDANFEAALEALGYDDISGDGQVPTAIIEVVTSLDVSNGSISDMTGIQDFLALEYLNCRVNPLESIDLSNNAQLKTFISDSSRLDEIDVTNNPLLEVLDVSANDDIAVLNLSNNSLLRELTCNFNSITALDLSNNTVLEVLIAYNNNLTSLDLTSNAALVQLDARNNSLTSLDIKNGNNTNMTTFDVRSNSGLFCINVDDKAYSTTNWTQISSGMVFSDDGCRYTQIPDTNFEAALNTLGYDDLLGDGQVPTALIEVITTLELNNQNISDLTGINDFIALESLKLQYNSLTSLDVSSLVNLKTLWASNGNIFNTIDVSNNTALQDFRIRQYKGTTIDLSANTALTRFACTSCDLETVDTSNNPNLNFLDLWDSDITSIDVSSNINLATLDVAYTNLSELDLSLNTGLTNLIAHDINSLTSLNVKNGTNTSITGFKTAGTPVPCILVDDVTYSTTNWTNIDATSTFSNTYCNYTAIPDANFEAELEALGYDDISGDGQVPTALIEVVTALDVNNKNISDLTGIEDFTALIELIANANNITSIDISQNVDLETLIIGANDLTVLDISNNTLLKRLDVLYNDITTLDTRNNPNLVTLKAYNTDVTSYDFSNNPLLEKVEIYNNNALTALDVSNLSQLDDLRINNTGISVLDLSNNPNLRIIRASDSNIQSLDLSIQTSLIHVYVDNTPINHLNVKNGNNTNFTQFHADGTPNLNCAVVDDATFSTTNWTNVDVGMIFNDTFCRYTAIPDANFETRLNTLGYDDIAGDGQVPTALIEGITTLDVSNQNIADLTGIEGFTALVDLNVETNTLTSLDLSNNTNLQALNFDNNTIANLNLGAISNLTSIEGRYNQLLTIDLSKNTNLTFVNLRDNLFTSLDVSSNPLLETINLRGCTNLTSIDISNNPNVKFLYFQDTLLNGLDVSQNPLLEVIVIERVNFNSIDVSNLPLLRQLRIADNSFTSLDVSNNPALVRLECENNNLTYLNLKNGNNTNMPNGDFIATGNTSLTCIIVDDAIYSATNWTNIDGTASFTDADYCQYTDIPDANFEARLEALGHDDISGDGKVPTRLIKEVTSLTVNGHSVSDFTGIEDFTGLTYLDVGNNNITSLDVSNLILLEFLRVDGNSLTSLDLSNNTILVDLRCSYNSGIAGLDLSSNTLLETAHLGNNSIASLDVSNNTLLYDLRLTGNNLTTLSVTNNTALQTLIVSSNPLTTLDLTANIALTSFYGTNCGLTTVTNINSTVLQDLYLQRNNLTSIDFSSSAATITNVYLSENSITDLDFTGAISLKKLSVYENNISSLDVTQAVSLEEVYVTDNDLTYFNIKNGNNTAIHEFHADNNPSLTCILVDDASTSTTRWISGIDNTASFSDTYCRYTAIPDSIFEARLESLGYDDISGDGQVPTALIETVTSLTVNDLGINELTGIENFTALVTLNARGNNFTTLDVSENVLLQHLYINSNSLPSIDVSKNVVLRNLNIGSNSITSLDVSNNPDLRDLWVQGNGGLTSLDLSNNLEIRELYTYSSGISTLDLSIHVELRILSAYRTSMTSIDLSNNPELRSLRVDETNISTLDLTNNTKIETLRVNDTGIAVLDLSNQTNLEKLWAHDTSLGNLNVRNGNNTNVTTFEIENNPNLTCVLVDDLVYSSTNWTNKDATTNFSDTYCEYTSIPDANFEATLEALGYDDISGDGQVPTPLIEVVEDLAIVSKSIADITGIEDFIALKTLNCAGNTFTSLDLSNNTQLTSVITKFTPLTTLNISNSTNLDVLVCSFNNLTTLDVSNNIALTYLECNNNNLTNLGVSLNTALLDLRCGNNSLTAIDVSTNTALTSFWCQDNSITDLDLSNQTGLVSITVNNNSLTSLNVKNGNNTNVTNFIATGNPSLTCITVDDAAYSTTNWLGVDDTASFNNLGCRYTQIPDVNFEAELEALGYDDISGDGQVPTYLIEGITTLNVNNLSITDFTGIEDFVGLTHLDVGNNNAGSIDITSLVLLEFVRLDAMSLTSIDLSKNIALTDLRCSFNTGITSIDVSNNALLETAHIGNNGLTSIDLSNNTLLYELRMSNNKLTSVDLSNNTALTELNLSNNELSSLNLKNANNTNIVLIYITGNPLLSCVLVDDANYSTINWTNIDNTTSFSDTSCLGVQIALKVYLQGAFLNPNTGEESLMRDDLRVSGGVYGSTSPYSDSATISDAIKVDDAGSDSMVDWVWVELRDADNPSQVIAGKSGILQRDGDVVAITDDRNSPMSFNVSADNYYIVIKHRNHLNIMTAAVINLSKTITTVDLSSTNTAVAGGVNGVVDMGSGIFAMISGDFDENGQIQNIDTNSVIQQLGVSGYNKADFDMNGQVQNSDINNLLNPNIGRGEQLLK
ncbi:hypothetical protein [Tenacibaculum sp. 190130A14a]